MGSKFEAMFEKSEVQNWLKSGVWIRPKCGVQIGPKRGFHIWPTNGGPDLAKTWGPENEKKWDQAWLQSEISLAYISSANLACAKFS